MIPDPCRSPGARPGRWGRRQVIKAGLEDPDPKVRFEAVELSLAYLYGRPGPLEQSAPLGPVGERISPDLVEQAQRLLTEEP